jgi:hypothetical protein
MTSNSTQPAELRLYPSWKHALQELELAGLEPGQTIEKDWLEEKFGLSKPTSIADHERNHQLFRTAIWQLRETLLEKHSLMLRAVAGIGYRVVEPEKQTDQAMRDRGEEICRALAKLHSEVTHIRMDALTDTQRKANADAQAKVGMLLGLTRKKLGQ